MPEPAPVTTATLSGEAAPGERADGGVGRIVLGSAPPQRDPLDRAHACCSPSVGDRREPLAQRVLQDLAGRVARHGVDQLELLGDGLDPEALAPSG